MKNITETDQSSEQEPPAIDPPEPSMIAKPMTNLVAALGYENRRVEWGICSECGVKYERTVWIRRDRSEIAPGEQCKACAELAHQAELREELAAELKDVEKEQRVLWRGQCGVEGRFNYKSFDNFNGKLQPEAYKALSEWIDGDRECSVTLASPDTYGVGKTHLVCALANRLITEWRTVRIVKGEYIGKYACPVYFISEARLMSRIRATYNKHNEECESDEDIYQYLGRVGLLIIDDIGKVRPRDPSFLQGAYYRIIDDRYVNERPIIATTNLSMTDLETHIGGATADRLREMCGKGNIITMAGVSQRRQK